MISYINCSLVSTGSMCMENLRRRYIENDFVPAGIAAKIGHGLHGGAELNHREKKVTGKDEPLDVIKDAARDSYISSCGEGVFFPREEAPTARAQLSAGLDIAVSLTELYAESLAPKIQPELIEKEVYLAVPELPLPIRGTVDLTADGGKWLPDLKTAKAKWPQQKADQSLQKCVYPSLVEHATGRSPERFTFEVFTKTKVPKHHSVAAEIGIYDLQSFITRARVMMDMIYAGIFPPAEPGHWKCSPKWCEYWWSCRYVPAHKKTLPRTQ